MNRVSHIIGKHDTLLMSLFNVELEAIDFSTSFFLCTLDACESLMYKHLNEPDAPPENTREGEEPPDTQFKLDPLMFLFDN